MKSPTILVGGLTRRYRGQLALDDVAFDVQGVSITGLLGRNGAGKTTLLRKDQAPLTAAQAQRSSWTECGPGLGGSWSVRTRRCSTG
jgi:ABC-type uncharacterized transport system ATPase subunit